LWGATWEKTEGQIGFIHSKQQPASALISARSLDVSSGIC